MCYFPLQSSTLKFSVDKRKKEVLWSKNMVLLVHNFIFISQIFYFLQQNWNLIKSFFLFFFCSLFSKSNMKTRTTSTTTAAARSRRSPLFILYFYRIPIIHFLIPFSKRDFFCINNLHAFFYLIFMNKHRELFDGDFAIQRRRLHLNRKTFYIFHLNFFYLFSILYVIPIEFDWREME